MNINSFEASNLNSQAHSYILPVNDGEYITRSEMAQVMVTIVNHYEKRISALEQAYTQLLEQMKSARNTKGHKATSSRSSNPLQSSQNQISHTRISQSEFVNQSEYQSTELTDCRQDIIEELQNLINPNNVPPIQTTHEGIRIRQSGGNPRSIVDQENVNPQQKYQVDQVAYVSAQKKLQPVRKGSNGDLHASKQKQNSNPYQSPMRSNSCSLFKGSNAIKENIPFSQEQNKHLTTQDERQETSDFGDRESLAVQTIEKKPTSTSYFQTTNTRKNQAINSPHEESDKYFNSEKQLNKFQCKIDERNMKASNLQIMLNEDQQNPLYENIPQICKTIDGRSMTGKNVKGGTNLDDISEKKMSAQRSQSSIALKVQAQPNSDIHCILQKQNLNKSNGKQNPLKSSKQRKQNTNTTYRSLGQLSGTGKKNKSVYKHLVPSTSQDKYKKYKTPIGQTLKRYNPCLGDKKYSSSNIQHQVQNQREVFNSSVLTFDSKLGLPSQNCSTFEVSRVQPSLNEDLNLDKGKVESMLNKTTLLKKKGSRQKPIDKSSGANGQNFATTTDVTSKNNLSLFSVNQESRLHSLAQTIQKYKEEGSIGPQNNQSQEKKCANRRKSANVGQISQDVAQELQNFQSVSSQSQSHHTQSINLRQQNKKAHLKNKKSLELEFTQISIEQNEIHLDNDDRRQFELERTGKENSSHRKSRNSRNESNRNPGQEYFSFSKIDQEVQDQLEELDAFGSVDKFAHTLKLTERVEGPKVTFLDLTGDVFDIIAEYLTEKTEVIPPYFVLINSQSLEIYTTYKIENYNIQNEILQDQIVELKKELFDYFDQKLFKMSKNVSIIYQSNINSKEWSIFQDLCENQLLGKEDLILIRVYLILLGIKPSNCDSDLQQQMFHLISDNRTRLNQIFNPELHFTFNPCSLTQIGHLLKAFSLENYIVNYGAPSQQNPSKKIRTFQIMAQIVYEALQFCKIVPNRIESDIRELEKVIEHYFNMQERLQKLVKIKK